MFEVRFPEEDLAFENCPTEATISQYCSLANICHPGHNEAVLVCSVEACKITTVKSRFAFNLHLTFMIIDLFSLGPPIGLAVGSCSTQIKNIN